MRARVLSARDENAIPQALAVLERGGLVAFPTDTVYGVGTLAFSEAAVRKLYMAKGRGAEKAVPILGASKLVLEQVAHNLVPEVWRLAEAFWPGPLTLVVPKRPELPAAVSIYSTVGVRVPDHDLAQSLLALAGPLAVTSANRSGEASSISADMVLEALGGRIDLVIDGGKTPGGQPSTVLDCSNPDFPLLRQGPISDRAIRSML